MTISDGRENSPSDKGDKKPRQINLTDKYGNKVTWPNYLEEDIERWITNTSKKIAKIHKENTESL